MNREVPIAFRCVGGPRDGQIENLWPSKFDALRSEIAFLDHEALRAGSPGLWFAVYARLRWKPPEDGEPLMFVRWDWRERWECEAYGGDE